MQQKGYTEQKDVNIRMAKNRSGRQQGKCAGGRPNTLVMETIRRSNPQLELGW